MEVKQQSDSARAQSLTDLLENTNKRLAALLKRAKEKTASAQFQEEETSKERLAALLHECLDLLQEQETEDGCKPKEDPSSSSSSSSSKRKEEEAGEAGVFEIEEDDEKEEEEEEESSDDSESLGDTELAVDQDKERLSEQWRNYDHYATTTVPPSPPPPRPINLIKEEASCILIR